MKQGRKKRVEIQLIRKYANVIKRLLELCPLLDEAPSTTLASVQKFVPGCKTYGDFTGEELNSIPAEEMHKLALDVILFNCDRHMNNILFKEGNVVLIDHGSSLPNPSGGAVGLKDNARYEWMSMPQFDLPLHEKYASGLADLDIDETIAALKKDQQEYVEKFGERCEIDEECYDLIRLNLHIIQVGIRIGASLKDVALMQAPIKKGDFRYGGEIPDLCQEHRELLREGSSKDWRIVEEDIEAILRKPMFERVCNY